MRRVAIIFSLMFALAPLLALLPSAVGAQETNVQPGVSGNSYKSPRHGYKLRWDDQWRVIAATSDPDSDMLGITDGRSQVILASYAYSAPLGSCPSGAEHAILANDPHLSDIKPQLGADSKPVTGSSSSRAFAVYTDTLAASDGSNIALVDRLECRWIVKHASVLVIDEEIRQDSLAAEQPLVQAVMATLTIPAPRHTKTAAAKPAASPVAAGTPSTADVTYLKTLTAQPAGTVKMSLSLYDTLVQNPQPDNSVWLNRLSFVFVGWADADLEAQKPANVPARYAKLHQAYLDAIAPLVDATKQMTNAEDWIAGRANTIDLSGVNYDALAQAVAESRSRFAAYDKLLNSERAKAGLPPL